MKLAVAFLLHCSLSCFVTFTGAAETALSTGFYFDFVDCGDENRMVKFSASVTPYPAMLSSVQISLWLGGRVEFTERAEQFARNISADQWIENVRADIFVDPESDYFFNRLSLFNHTKICVDDDKQIVACEFFQALHASMLARKSTAMLFPIDINELNNKVLYQMWIILKNLPTPLLGQVRVNMKYYDTTVFCTQWNVRTEAVGQYTEFDMQRHNFAAAFSTLKVEDISNRNQLIGPPNAKEYLNQSDCQCVFPHSGPYCMFQCNLDQVRPENLPCSLGNEGFEGSEGCSFTSLDYSNMCLLEQHITFLDGEIVAIANGFSSVTVRWRMKNYYVVGPYIGKFTVHNAKNGAQLGLFTKRLSYGEGLESELNLTTLRYSETGSPFDLKLESFSVYTLTISLRSTSTFGNDIVYIDAGKQNFATSEDIPQKPRILEAKIISEPLIEFDWFLVGGHCPGVITHFDIHYWCSKKNHQGFVENSTWTAPFNCTESANYPHLYLPMQENCNGDALRVQLRVATSKGHSGWSDMFIVPVPNKRLSPWEIAAIAIGGIILAATILCVAFLIYYKTRVLTYFKSHDLLLRRKNMPLPRLPVNGDPSNRDDGYAVPQIDVVSSSEEDSERAVNQESECPSTSSTSNSDINVLGSSSQEYPRSISTSYDYEYIESEWNRDRLECEEY